MKSELQIILEMYDKVLHHEAKRNPKYLIELVLMHHGAKTLEKLTDKAFEEHADHPTLWK